MGGGESLIKCIETLRSEASGQSYGLQDMPPVRIDGFEVLAENRMTDPCQPEPPESGLRLLRKLTPPSRRQMRF